jgi:hypothetical protein
VPLKLNAEDSSQHFSIQGFVFAYQDLAMIAVILKKDYPNMLLENLVSGGFINIIGLLIDQYGNEIGRLWEWGRRWRRRYRQG